MNDIRKLTLLSFVIITVLVIADQALKVWVKLNMNLFEVIPIIGDKVVLYFVENDGMAFGMSFGGKVGKVLLSLLRLGILSGVIYYLVRTIKRKEATVFTTSIFALIIAGAIGNLIDGMFYGMIFDYAPFMFGNVVDMFYCPLFMLPDWVPVWGGTKFFPAIFNIADSCITVGLFIVIIFHKHFFKENKIS